MSAATDRARELAHAVRETVSLRITQANPYTGDLVLPLAAAIDQLADACDSLGRVLNERTEHLL